MKEKCNVCSPHLASKSKHAKLVFVPSVPKICTTFSPPFTNFVANCNTNLLDNRSFVLVSTCTCTAKQSFFVSQKKSVLEIVQQVKDVICKKQLIESSMSVIVSISGGQDSIFLLLCLSFLQSKMAFTFKMLWCNHFWQSDSFYTTLHLTMCAVNFQKTLITFLPLFVFDSDLVVFFNIHSPPTCVPMQEGELATYSKFARRFIRRKLAIAYKSTYNCKYKCKAKLCKKICKKMMAMQSFALQGQRKKLCTCTASKSKLRPMPFLPPCRYSCNCVALAQRAWASSTYKSSWFCTPCKYKCKAKLCKKICKKICMGYKSPICTQNLSPLQIKDLHGAKCCFSKTNCTCKYLWYQGFVRAVPPKGNKKVGMANAKQSFAYRRFAYQRMKVIDKIKENNKNNDDISKHLQKGYVKTATSETLARHWRHLTTERSCTFYTLEKAIYGHTLSDRVETIMFNLVRGAGNTGIQSLLWKRKFSTFFYNWFFLSFQHVFYSTHFSTFLIQYLPRRIQ